MPSSTVQSKKRIEFFDLAKGICIFLVVVYHISSHYEIELPANNIIKSIRLPLYFFLSGCFFKTYGGFIDFIKRKCNKLLLPFTFWFFFALILTFILSCFGVTLFTYYKLTLRAIIVNTIRGTYPNSPIWFLLCLFWVNIYFYLIYIICSSFKEQNRPFLIGMFSVIAGLIGVSLSNFGIRVPFYMDSALTALPFFTFGYYLFRFTSIAKPNIFDKWIPLIIIILLLILYFISPSYSLRKNTNINYHNFVLVYLCGFMGALSVILFSKLFNKLSIVSYWGRYSIMILVSHGIVYRLISIFVLSPITARIKWDNIVSFSVNIVLTMTICTILIPFFKKYMPHVTAQKDIIPVGDKSTQACL